MIELSCVSDDSKGTSFPQIISIEFLLHVKVFFLLSAVFIPSSLAYFNRSDFDTTKYQQTISQERSETFVISQER